MKEMNGRTKSIKIMYVVVIFYKFNRKLPHFLVELHDCQCNARHLMLLSLDNQAFFPQHFLDAQRSMINDSHT